jgi:hypothetical protein
MPCLRRHGGTYWNDNGGEYAAVGVAWLGWHLLGETSDMTKGMFVGDALRPLHTRQLDGALEDARVT